MKPRAVVWLAVLALAVGGLRAEPLDAVKGSRNLVLVFAIPPSVAVQHVGVVSFNRGRWSASVPDFNPSEAAVAQARNGLRREVRILDNHAVDTFTELGLEPLDVKAKDKLLIPQLASLSKALHADYVLVITACKSSDWMGKREDEVTGVGIAHYGVRAIHCYASLEMRVFDARKRKIIAKETAERQQAIQSFRWKESWEEFTALERLRFQKGLAAALSEAVPDLLSRVALMDAPPPKGQVTLFSSVDADVRSWLPEGNTIPIPEGVTAKQAGIAVAQGMARRGWSVEMKSLTEVVGTLKDGANEAVETATIQGDVLTLVPAMFRIRKDGGRETRDPHLRWHRNLKATIIDELERVAAMRQPSER